MSDQKIAAGPVVDWLAFSIQTQDLAVTVNDLQNRFHGSTPCGFGGFGYTHSCYVLGTGRIYWHPERREMGCYVVLPSTALGSLCALEHYTPRQFVQEFQRYGAKFTRIDIAIDSETVHMDQIVASNLAGQVVSRSRPENWDYRLNGKGGQTLYLGSRNSDRFVRFYDKAKEQDLQGDQVWTRCEVEFKRDAAEILAAHIAKGGCLREVVLATVDFRIDDDSNKSRRTRCDWWQDWVLVLDSSVSFAVKKVEKTIADAYNWLQKQVAPTMAFVSMALGNCYWLNDMAEQATGRISPFKAAIIQAYEGDFAFVT